MLYMEEYIAGEKGKENINFSFNKMFQLYRYVNMEQLSNIQ